MRRALIWMAAGGVWATVAWGEGPRPFLFLKTGEKFATQEAAGPTVAGLTGYLGEKLFGATNAFVPRVWNDPVKAAEFAAASKPVVGIVTPGFYLAYAKTLAMEPLLETRREGVGAERWVLVAKKAAPAELSAWAGKSVATSLAAEQRYVTSVVLANKLGEEVRLVPASDLEGAAFDLAEGAPHAADLVLVEETAWKLLADDPEVGGKLKVIYRSEALPADLVVLFRSNATDVPAEKLAVAMKAMSGDDAGRKVLGSIRVAEFTGLDRDRLARVQELFYGK